MATGRDACAWNHTSHMLAAILNSNPWREGDPCTPKQLNPYLKDPDAEEDDGPELDAVGLALLVCGPEAVEVFNKADLCQAQKP